MGLKSSSEEIEEIEKMVPYFILGCVIIGMIVAAFKGVVWWQVLYPVWVAPAAIIILAVPYYVGLGIAHTTKKGVEGTQHIYGAIKARLKVSKGSLSFTQDEKGEKSY